MAILHPTFEVLNRQTVPLTSGERVLLEFLQSNLNDSFEIFSQPFLNGDRPDIIIVRKNSGVIIIEVKNWDLRHYTQDEKGRWKVNDAIIRSPIDQVLKYKENLFNLHIPNLLEKNIKEPKHWGIVNCAIYFHNSSTKQLTDFIYRNASEKKKKFLSHFDLLGYDALEKDKINAILHQRRMNRKSYFFTKELYDSIKIFLQPPQHTIEQGKTIPYTPEQIKLSKSENGKEQKIKGVAGCGKTLVLAKRAVNAHKRTNKKILILTYNITLVNYIHDRISEVRENFEWGNFHIINYHDFISQEINNLGLKIEIPDDFDEWKNKRKSEYLEKFWFSNEKLFNNASDKIIPYESIFIDEVQDYQISWLRIIKKFFLSPNGEFVLFGDEKQNIYKLTMDVDKKPKTNIPGNWNQTLNKTFRLSNKAAAVAIAFQKNFFKQKYEIDVMEIDQTNLFQETFVYKSIPTATIADISNFIFTESEKIKAHPNDNCVLAGKIETLKELDSFVRHSTLQNTQTMFETKEVEIKLFFDYHYKDEEKILKQGEKQFKYKINNLISSLCYWQYLDHPAAETKFQKLISRSYFDFDSYREWINKLNSTKQVYNKPSKTEKYLYSNGIELIRKNKKKNFRMNPGFIKLSTIHSFKGWEIKNLFLIIEKDEDDSFISPELVYTALTRCQFNLFVINIGNDLYNNFFDSLSVN